MIWWRHQMETFSVLLAILRGIHRSPVNSPHKGQWRRALIFSLICVWINGWVNTREAGDLICYCAHYDVSVMEISNSQITPFVLPHAAICPNLRIRAWPCHVTHLPHCYNVSNYWQLYPLSNSLLNSLFSAFLVLCPADTTHSASMSIHNTTMRRLSQNPCELNTPFGHSPYTTPHDILYYKSHNYVIPDSIKNGHWMSLCLGQLYPFRAMSHGPLARYVNLTEFDQECRERFLQPPRCVTHVPWCMSGSRTSGFLWSWCRGKRSRHSRRMRTPACTYLVIGPWNTWPGTAVLSTKLS